MERKKSIKISALATGTLMLGAFASGNATAADNQGFEDLGSGAEMRSELLTNNNPVQFMNNREVELKCGEGTCGEKSKEGKADKKAKASDDKAAEHKCGEGKCGEEKKADKKAEKKDKKAEATEDKAGEGKCGEGKCGEGKCGN